MVKSRARQRELARAKWQRQQQRRMSAATRARRLQVLGGVVASVVGVVLLGWLVTNIVQSENGPSTPDIPTLLQPTNPGQTVITYQPPSGTPTPSPSGHETTTPPHTTPTSSQGHT